MSLIENKISVISRCVGKSRLAQLMQAYDHKGVPKQSNNMVIYKDDYSKRGK